MVAIAPLEELLAQAKVFAGLITVGGVLHRPGDGGVVQHMRCHFVVEPGVFDDGGKGAIDPERRLPVPFNGEAGAVGFPAPDMAEKAVRKAGSGWRFLVSWVPSGRR